MSTKVEVGVPTWLFIHIPKTGGTYFKNMLRCGAASSAHAPTPRSGIERLGVHVENLAHAFPYNFTVDGWNPQASKYSHMPFLKDVQYNRVYKPIYSMETDNIEYVTIVRNPFSLLYSYWRYQPNAHADWTANSIKYGGWANCNILMGTKTFPEFVEHYLYGETWHIPPLKENLFAQLYKKNGTLVPKLENVLRCEHLKKEAVQWCEKNNIEYTTILPVGAANINPIKDDYKDKYTPLQRHLLEHRWHNILETFGYHFGGIKGE